MADEQIILEIKVDDKDVLNAKKNFDDLSKEIDELTSVVSNARKENKQYQKDIQRVNKELKDGKLKQYEGNYTDYLQYKKTHGLKEDFDKNHQEVKTKKTSIKNSKEKKKKEAELRQSISAERRNLE